MAIDIGKDAPTITISGDVYTLHMSDNDILSLCREVRRRVLDIHIDAEGEVLDFLKWATERLDALLGDGAALAIFGTTPIDLAGIVRLYYAIADERSKAHRQYIHDKYGA